MPAITVENPLTLPRVATAPPTTTARPVRALASWVAPSDQNAKQRL
ncbi:hypothetical protein [Streptomyces sp. PT12]|nr:hypothetical protein [Streptomyces sp. PT12]